MNRSHRLIRDDLSEQRIASRRPTQLTTLAARVRSVGLTPQGHLCCVLDTPAGRLKALSDAAAMHYPQLAVGSAVEVALLKLRRVTESGVWHWQLLGCRVVQGEAVATPAESHAGSAA